MPPKKITNSPNILSRVALDLIFMLEATRREPNRIHRCLQQTLFYSSLYFAKSSCFLAGIGSRCHHKYPKKHWICPRWIHRVKVPPPEPLHLMSVHVWFSSGRGSALSFRDVLFFAAVFAKFLGQNAGTIQCWRCGKLFRTISKVETSFLTKPLGWKHVVFGNSSYT